MNPGFLISERWRGWLCQEEASCQFFKEREFTNPSGKFWPFKSLQEAIASEVPHISVYDLQVEDNTSFGRWYRPGQSPLPSDEISADMYREASSTLREAGFCHYEISNYAQPGHQSRHNRAYWENRPFFGFGCGAASYLDGHRYKRPGKIADYTAWVLRLHNEGWDAATGAADVDREERNYEAAFDEIMVGLRLREGIDMQALEERRGNEWTHKVLAGAKPALTSGWMSLSPVGSVDAAGVAMKSPQRQTRLRLTDPDGFLHSNAVISDIFAALLT